jgi:Xaa-Pro aminopeptidase
MPFARKRALGKRAPREIRDLREPLDRMRLIKDAHEIDTMRRAAAISLGRTRPRHARLPPRHGRVRTGSRTGHEFRKRGADGHAYTPIVAGGANACVLHYIENNKLLPNTRWC